MSRQPCTICTHPERTAINASLEADVRQLVIAKNFNVSKFALSRHKKGCLAPTPEIAGDQTVADRWLARADDLYLSSAASGDVKSQIAALSAAVRSLQFADKQLKKKADADRALPRDVNEWTAEESTKFVSFLDSIVAKHDSLSSEVPQEIVDSMPELDGARATAKQALKEQLRTYARVWINLHSNIEALPETLRLLRFNLKQMEETNKALRNATVGATA
jgi:hypothetical protein